MPSAAAYRVTLTRTCFSLGCFFLLCLCALALLVCDPLMRFRKLRRGLLRLFGSSGAFLGFPPLRLFQVLPASGLVLGHLAAFMLQRLDVVPAASISLAPIG